MASLKKFAIMNDIRALVKPRDARYVVGHASPLFPGDVIDAAQYGASRAPSPAVSTAIGAFGTVVIGGFILYKLCKNMASSKK